MIYNIQISGDSPILTSVGYPKKGQIQSQAFSYLIAVVSRHQTAPGDGLKAKLKACYFVFCCISFQQNDTSVRDLTNTT